MAYRPWTSKIQRIAQRIHKHISDRYDGITGIDTSEEFNAMTLLSFTGEKRVPPHRDNLYDKKGKFRTDKNSQKENSLTCILVIGDTRQLVFQLKRSRNVLVAHEGAKQIRMLQHGSLFVLNPNCERPAIRALFDENNVTYWEHGQNSPSLKNRNGMSIGFAFRVCKDGCFIEADTGKLSITEEEKQSSKNNFQQNNIILEKFMANQKVRKSAEKEIKKSYVHMRKRYQTRVHPIRKYPIRKYRKVTK